MAGGEVFVIDRVVTRPGRAREFVDTYLAGYAPEARKRGMTLCTVLVRLSTQHRDHHLVTAQRAGVVGDDLEGAPRSRGGRLVGRCGRADRRT